MIERDEDFDPDRLVGCAYWRCDEIFEQRTSNHQYCYAPEVQALERWPAAGTWELLLVYDRRQP
jgi:hypothetical protein